MKVLSLFSGIGAFEKALDNLKIPYELVNYCEIDKYASKSYSLIHNVPETLNLGDITKVDTSKLPKDIDLITYGFPCQDISLAGKQKGFEDNGERTRSGLFFEALRIIEDTKPKIAIAENVKNLTSKKFKNEFEIVLNSLEEVGYNNYWQVLNAKDYGIPQNRERVFIVSIRKDIDSGTFDFPKPFELKLRLKDMLEDKVDEKYYLSGEKVDKLIAHLIDTKQIKDFPCCCDSTINDPKVREISNCITARYDTGIQNQKQIDLCVVEPKIIQVGELDIKGQDKVKRVFSPDGISPTLDTMQGGNRQPKILVVGKTKSEGQRSLILDEEGICNCLSATDFKQPKQILIREATKKGYSEAEEGDSINLEYPNSTTRRGRVGKQVAQTLTCQNNQGVVVKSKNGLEIPLYKDTKQLRETIEINNLYEDEPANLDLYNRAVYEHSQTLTDPTHNSQRLWDGLRIRKLTPKECWRLMGFDDEDIDKAAKELSNTQLYKQAGNSIVVDVLEHLLSNLFQVNKEEVKSNKYVQSSIFDFINTKNAI